MGGVNGSPRAKRVKELLALTLLLATVAPLHAQNPAPANPATGGARGFPFVLPWDDASRTITDVSALNPAPLNEPRRVAVKGGHFVDRTGRRVRFFGTNITAGACFPRKEDAATIAARLRKFGFNCVRLHHMDAPWSDPNLFHFRGGSFGKKTDRLDPRSLDRLDHFVYQLGRHGIYVDVNLHVTRAWGAADGFPEADRIDQQGKVVAYFEPRAIALQKQFARQLLDRRNPYTKLRYADDPAVALVELNNEDSLLGSSDAIRTMPPHYRNVLGRDPTGDPGLNFWLNNLASGTPRPDIVVGISESEEHQDIRASVIDNGIQFLDQPFL